MQAIPQDLSNWTENILWFIEILTFEKYYDLNLAVVKYNNGNIEDIQAYAVFINKITLLFFQIQPGNVNSSVAQYPS